MKHSIRILTLLLAALTMTLCLVACSSGKGGSELVFVVEGDEPVRLEIGAKSEPIIEKMGHWITVNYTDSCGGFAGKDADYTYKGYTVSTTPAKDGQIICKVTLTDDSVKTPEGLYIGMSRSDAEKAMKGFSSEAAGDNLVYTAGSVRLQVAFRDGAVTGIVYVAA